jgi:hypothetical protein
MLLLSAPHDEDDAMQPMPRRNIRAELHLLACSFVLVAAACRADERPLPIRESQRANETTGVSAEKPLWKFGEESTRIDVLPAELDTMATWGDYPESTRPVAYGIDLNGDGSKEWFVRANRRVCGYAGCPTALLTRSADGRFIDVLDGLVREVYVTNRRAGGWPVLWVLVGGRDGGLHRVEFKSEYSLSRTLSPAPAAARDSLAALLMAAPSR